jgi:2,3-bisphosphoglycerate-dependent phosphoglycerate mutase
MQLYFIRHAQSGNNALWDATASSDGRSDDPAITDIGKRQAAITGAYLAQPYQSSTSHVRDMQNRNGFGITHLYCSLMLRAVQTGDAISRAIGVPLVAWEELHEIGGIYLDDENGIPHGRGGKPRSYFAEHFPDLCVPDSLDEQGWWRSRSFELYEHSLQRAQRFLAQLIERHGNTDARVAVVSHGAFFTRFMGVLLGMQKMNESAYWFSMNNCAIARIDFDAHDRRVIVYQNRLVHLEGDLIT